MMEAMYRKFGEEHGLRLAGPQRSRYSATRRSSTGSRAATQTQFDTLGTMLTNEKLTVMHRFFETLASQVRRVYQYANKEAETWLRAVMSPMEMQIREHQLQLRRRLESIKRIHHATDTLEDRVSELEQVETTLMHQLDSIHHLAAEIERVLEMEHAPSYDDERETRARRGVADRRAVRGLAVSSVRRGQAQVLRVQRLAALDVVGIERDAVDRAHLRGIAARRSARRTRCTCPGRSRRSPAPARSRRSGTPARRRRS